MVKRLHYFILGLIVLASFILMLNASFQESAIMDELAHIPASYGYVKYLDYRLNPEHPPLVKILAAVPLLFQNLNFPIDKSAWQTDINGQWQAGAQFLYESGNDADKIIRWSRLGPMLLTLILIIFIYIWGKELIGRWWALLPSFLFAFSPTVLVHGHYVTTDLGAALGIFVPLYYFIKLLHQPSLQHLIFAGLTFGIAQLMKFSAVLLIPFFIFIIAVFLLWKLYRDWDKISINRFKKNFFQTFYCAKTIIFVFIIGYLLVYFVYLPITFNYPVEKQKSDTEFILTSFAGGQNLNNESCSVMKCLAKINVYMSGNKILRPLGQYMLGVLMVLQRSSGGNTGYFLGEVSASGWWYYFPTIFALKEPVSSLILIFLAALFGFYDIIKKIRVNSLNLRQSASALSDYFDTHFSEFTMLAFVIFYWAYSIKSPLNIGIRHILPTMPFIYILTAGAFKKWTIGIDLTDFNRKITQKIKRFAKTFLKTALIVILALWYFTETLMASPHYLSYFNQFGGGINNGYVYVTDSNYDWGQDLKRLKDWTDKNLPAGEQVAVDYFGGGSPRYYLGEKFEPWQSAKENPTYYGIKWLAISINNLQSALGKLHPGQLRNPEDEYLWLKEIKNPYHPDYKAGKSIFIYKLE